MNDNTNVKYNLARMYEYVNDIFNLCNEHNFKTDDVLNNKYNRYAINMCIVQMGEHANRIKVLDAGLYNDEKLSLFRIKGMRDRITHSYGNIDYDIVKNVLEIGIPELKRYLENNINHEVLQNPYVLYEIEYEDLVSRSDVKMSYDEIDKEINKINDCESDIGKDLEK